MTGERLLTTARLALRAFRPDDGPQLHAYLGDPEVVRFEPYPVPDRAWCDTEACRRAADRDFWAITVPSADGPDLLVGNLWLHPVEEAPATWELGFVLGRPWWHRGYAQEVCRRLLDHVVEDRAAHRVVARCDPDNVASWRLLERLGLRREAHHRQAVTFTTTPDGAPLWHDELVYAVLGQEWASRRGAASGRGPGQRA